jgi:hypothetical protein
MIEELLFIYSKIMNGITNNIPNNLDLFIPNFWGIVCNEIGSKELSIISNGINKLDKIKNL